MGSVDKKLTIVVPALNEEGKITDTIEGILPLASNLLSDFEMFLIDDGSTDNTGTIMDAYAIRDPRIQVIHHAKPEGVGTGFLEVLHRAEFEQITLIPGDHAYKDEGVGRLFGAAGTADIVISYRDNQADRSLNRSIQSHALRLILNCLFGFWLKDYHGMIVYPVISLRRIDVNSKGYGYQICSLISLLQLGLSYKQVSVSLNAELKGSSRVQRPSTYLALGVTIISLLLRRPLRKERRCFKSQSFADDRTETRSNIDCTAPATLE